jgi:hypothetical protein
MKGRKKKITEKKENYGERDITSRAGYDAYMFDKA